MKGSSAMTEPATKQDQMQVYLKLIEYKRSIGTTQWSVLSIFVTASEAIFVFAATSRTSIGRLLSILAVLVYWLGLLLYRRYREYNRQVSAYLVKLETDIGLSFQQHLNRTVHSKGLSTEQILVMGGVGYSVFALIVILV
jgi:hypothetical protein